MINISISDEHGNNIDFTIPGVTLTVGSAPAKTRPGPKPNTVVYSNKSSEFHSVIIEYLKDGARQSVEIREHVAQTFGLSGKDIVNSVAWALVELQNEGCVRSRNPIKTGPVTKLDNGLYALRSEKR